MVYLNSQNGHRPTITLKVKLHQSYKVKQKNALHFNDCHKNFHQSKEHLMRIPVFSSNLWNHM